mmetsp:Transcript_16616/g.49713  ORF Transcript_16616/g.49713 Transcript_16616/m.49713 type:complete len:254 (+) Transcript_16616:334-1095(+)
MAARWAASRVAGAATVPPNSEHSRAASTSTQLSTVSPACDASVTRREQRMRLAASATQRGRATGSWRPVMMTLGNGAAAMARDSRRVSQCMRHVMEWPFSPVSGSSPAGASLRSAFASPLTAVPPEPPLAGSACSGGGPGGLSESDPPSSRSSAWRSMASCRLAVPPPVPLLLRQPPMTPRLAWCGGDCGAPLHPSDGLLRFATASPGIASVPVEGLTAAVGPSTAARRSAAGWASPEPEVGRCISTLGGWSE